MEKGTPELLKAINKRTVLSLIVKEKIISRTELSTQSDLSKSTVCSIVDELLNENIIREKGEGTSTKLGGRKPIELIFNPVAGYVIAVDVGHYKSKCVIADLCGRVLSKDTVTMDTKDCNDNLSSIIHTVRSMIEKSEVRDKIIGIGIGIPGITDIDNGIAVSVPRLEWINIRIKEVFEKEFGLDVYIDNDVNMAVQGEKWLGAGSKYKDFVFVSIGHGIGSGIIIDNKIYRGNNYTSGEIGYLVLSKEALKRKYTFDIYGYFENVASASAVENIMKLSCRDTFELALKNDEKAKSAVNEMIDYLAMGISNIISILNPQAVILGGGVSRSGMQLLQPVKEIVSRLTPVPCRMELSELGDDAGVIGCIAAVITNKYGISFY
jgi:glucokinase